MTVDAAVAAARAADDKLGIDTVIIDVGDVLAIVDHFVITTGANPRQVRAIVEAVQEGVQIEHDLRPLRVEGLEDYEWVLLDYGPFVVHVFGRSARDLYALERLWGDRPVIDWATVDRT